MSNRGVINDKAGKAAALSKFSDTLTLSQPRGTDYAHPLALPHLKKIVIMPLSNKIGILFSLKFCGLYQNV